MALPYSNPALPSAPNPYFQDNSFVRGDNQRANNGFIWDNLEYLEALIDAAVARIATLEGRIPPGTIIPFGGFTVPTGTIVCNGAAVSRTTYANLFNAIVPSRGTVTISIASPGLVSLTSHGFITGDSIYLRTTGALPTGLSPNTLYYVVVSDANSFWLASSYANALANTRINTSGSQSGVHTLFSCPWGLGDGNLTFNVPDLSGAYLRGTGTSTLFTQNNTFPLGVILSDQLQGFVMGKNNNYSQRLRGTNIREGGGAAYDIANMDNVSINSEVFPITDNVNGTPRTGNETRPVTRGSRFAIAF